MSARDIKDLNTLRGSRVHRAALASLSDEIVTESSSEAAVLHAVMEAGMKAVRERVEAEGYAQIAREAAEYDRRAVARRRRPSWADE